MSRQKFASILLSIVISVIVIDVGLNFFLSSYLKNHILPGDFEKIGYIMNKCEVPFVLLGASQCANSFMVDVMEEELHTEIFNCGVNAQTIEFFDVVLDGMIRRKAPGQVLLVVRPQDLSSVSTERLSMMNIYYGHYSDLLDRYLDQGDMLKKIKNNSSLLRINTHWWRILLYHFISFNEMQNKGFIAKAVRDKYPEKKIKLDDVLLNIKEILPQKKAVLDHIVQNCQKNNIKLYITMVPTMVDYGAGGNVYAKLLTDYCRENDVLFFNDSQQTQITERPELFYDEFHLNADGAKIYTKMFLEKYHEHLKMADRL